jgi:hypothetical protein
MMQRYFLMVTALGEGGTGLVLLILPSVLLGLLLGIDQASPETTLCARIAGAALLALGVACWPSQKIHGYSVPLGLLAGVLIYDVAAAVLLSYAGLGLSMVGLVLWPAVVLHFALAIWCIICIVAKRSPTTAE